MDKRQLFVISQENIMRAGCADVKQAIDCAESAILSYSRGRVMFPDKVSQIFDDVTQDRTNCLPASLKDEKICGMKWVSVFPSNAKRGLKNLSAVVLLSDMQTGFPLALLEGTLCSNLRTAAVSATAAKYLSVKQPETLGFVGAGQPQS